MLRVNHFPLRLDIQVARSCYRHSNPHGYCGYLRRSGWDAVEEAGQVIVYHAQGTEPDEKREHTIRQILSADGHREQYSRGINAHVDQLLRASDFICVDSRQRREYISRSNHVVSLIVAERGPTLPALNARAHLRWTWDLEWCEGSCWLVPLAGRRFLTAQEPRFPSLDCWLRGRLAQNEKIKGIELNTGRHRTLTLQGTQWGLEVRGAWKTLDGDDWRVCLDMESLEQIGYSVEAFHSAQFTFDGLHAQLLRSSPFGKMITTTDPHIPSKVRAGTVSGTHLRFSKGTDRDMKEVHRLGILEHPPRPVRLLVAASQKDSEDKRNETRRILGAHLIDRSRLTAHPGGQDSLRSVGASDGRDTIATIWTSNKYGRGFKLPLFSLAKTRLHLYDAATGELLPGHALEEESEMADRDGVTLIALVLLDDDMAKPEHDRLMGEFRRMRMKALPTNFSSIARRSASVERAVDPKWLNLAIQLSQKAGAVPRDLAELPGVDEQTVFVGIDLGHDHANDRSNVAFTLFDNRGRPIDSRIERCSRNDERIPSSVLLNVLPDFIFERDRTAPTNVIVHRDGRYLDGEVDNIIDALPDVLLLTLVGVKKDTCTRLSGAELDGAFVELDNRRSILVTNTQSKKTSMPVPIEVELVYSNQLSLRQVVDQVYWFTRVCQGSAYFPKRLPATTGWANNVASTGKRVHLKGWEH